MLHQKSPRAILIVWAIVVVLLAPIFILFVPITITQTFFYDPSQIVVIAPTINHYLITAAFTILLAVLLLLAIKRTKWTYIFSGILSVTAITAFVFSTLSYIIIHPDYITIKEFTEKKDYPIENFATIIYEYGSGEPGRYQFITKDDKVVIIQDSPQLQFEKRRAIYKMALDHDMEFIERPLMQGKAGVE